MTITTNNLPANVELAQTAQPPVTIGFTDGQSFELAQRVGKMFSSSSLVPKEFQNNLGNCAIAINMAARIGADPLMVMQNLYLVHGRPGWSSQFLIATFNNNPKFSALRYEFRGEEGSDKWACRAWAVEKETQEKLEGAWVSIGLAKKEGWYGKNGSKWQSMPEQMLRYRAASWFIRAYAPEIAMGLHTAEELRETVDMEADTNGTYTAPSAADLNARLEKEGQKTEQSSKTDLNQNDEEELLAVQALGNSEAQNYNKLSAAERKTYLVRAMAEGDVQQTDLEKLCGKGFAQWSKKERVTLLSAYFRLISGEELTEKLN